MGKVRKLRKKYHALCVKNKNTEAHLELEHTNSTIFNKYSLEGSNCNDNKLENRQQDCENKSICSISKSIKSNLSGESITKKHKQRLRHELFLKKVNASNEILSKLKFSNKRKNKLKSKDSVPLICDNEKQEKNSPLKIPKKLQNNHAKGISKIRHKRLVEDVHLFKKILNNDSFSKNPHITVQNQTLEKLSQEYLESPLI